MPTVDQLGIWITAVTLFLLAGTSLLVKIIVDLRDERIELWAEIGRLQAAVEGEPEEELHPDTVEIPIVINPDTYGRHAGRRT